MLRGLHAVLFVYVFKDSTARIRNIRLYFFLRPRSNRWLLETSLQAAPEDVMHTPVLVQEKSPPPKISRRFGTTNSLRASQE
jgi:hypothetical protein